MSKSNLITPSLVGAVNWLREGPASWQERARRDLENQLGRVYSDEMPEPVKRGIEFENAVYACAKAGKTDVGTEHFQWFVKHCIGAEFQRKTKKALWLPRTDPGERPYFLYGKIDAWKPERILDIKTTGEFKGGSKYLGGFQHKMYCYCEHIADFSYLVAEMTNVEGKSVLLACYTVHYHVDDWDVLEKEVIATVLDVMAFLESDTKLAALYHDKFCLY